MKLENVKVDFQVSGWISENAEKTRFGYIGKGLIKYLEPHPKTLIYIAEKLYSRDENRVIFLLNYFMPKYERIVSEGSENCKINGFSLDDNYLDTFLGLTKNKGKSWLYIVRGIEYLCNEGHVIAAATDTKIRPKETYYSNGPSVKEIIKKEKNKSILIPAHPLFNGNLLTNLTLKYIHEPSGINLGIQEDKLRKYSSYWDALEANSSSMTFKQTKEVEKIAEELGLPTISDSDGDLEMALGSCNLFSFVDFSNPEKLRKSLIDGLNKRNGNNYHEIRKLESGLFIHKLKHLFINILQKRKYF